MLQSFASNLCFGVENCKHADQTRLRRRYLRSRHRTNPRPTRFVSGKAKECRWRPRRYQVDPWSRGRVVARGVLRFSPQPEKMPIFCHRRRIETCVVRFLNISAQMCLYRTPGRRPARITGRVVQHWDQRVGRSPYRARPVQIS